MEELFLKENENKKRQTKKAKFFINSLISGEIRQRQGQKAYLLQEKQAKAYQYWQKDHFSERDKLS